MTRPLRRRHLFIFAALLLLLPAGFWAGLHFRKPPPIADGLPPILSPDPLPQGAEALSAPQAVWDPPAVASRFQRTRQGVVFVELIADQDLVQPDLLLYFSPQPSPDGKALPPSARLLGSYAGSRPQAFPLPSEARQTSGWLLLYSLAHQELFSSLNLPDNLSTGGS